MIADQDPLVFWTEVYALAAAGTLVILGLAAWFSYQQLREIVRSRHAALLAEISRRWDEPLMVESRQLEAESGSDEELAGSVQFYFENARPQLFVLQRVPNFFEDLAVLVGTGAITYEMLEQSLGEAVAVAWARWRPSIEYLRGLEGNDPTVYEHFQQLAERVRAG